MINLRDLAGPAGVAILGRTLMALLFILAGVAKVTDSKPVLDQMQAFSVPTALFPAVVALELGGGLALLLGWRLREVAGALGIFCILAAFIFHHDLADKVERSIFFKDLAIAGGLLMLAAQTAIQKNR
ncbi:MAG: DoxX family membrane protein [Alphaproteobacteria bacterium]|uniref:DoxX family membrane protein n=1 Tax=Phenylobacterium sp. TaxID=1871053 RepID=UPI0025E03920|nr:DoxX family protein [Phenylobacterium sp.]MCA3757267.1 DoxX family protein [Phenylobacterium sp.]MCA6255170.1 DoxX family protein [Phenylobacterium sp.]MCA6278316.1 DoxX family protein [Phenylobacterium sp.]